MTELEEFINIWNDNCNKLSIQSCEFDKFVNIINKLEKNSKLDIQQKKIFIELIEIMAETIYTINNCADKYETKYGTTYYQQTKIYDEPELNCCSNLLNNLESEICWDLENEYDIAFTNNFRKNMEEEQCDICGRKCDGVHSNKIKNTEKVVQQMVSILESHGENMVDKIIKQIYENRRVKSEKV